MVSYVIINSTAAELTNVNVGGDDVAAYTISGDLVLTDAELATVASLNGVAVMQASASATEKDAVANTIIDYAAAAAPGESFILANGTSAQVANVNVGGDDAELGTQLTATLTPAELWDVLYGNDGVAAIRATCTTEEKRKAAKVMELGRIPGLSVAEQ